MPDTTTERESCVAGKTPKAQRMLYEVCAMCGGCGRITNSHNSAEDIPCVCKSLRVVETGLTVGQAEYMAELDVLRQEAGISAAMLRDGRAGAFRDLLISCEKALAAYDKACANGYSATWTGEDVDEMRAAVKKAKGPSV